MKWIILLLIPAFSFGQSPVKMFWMMNKAKGGMDSIKVNVDTTQTQTGTNWVNMTGDPSLRVFSVTGGNSSTITVTSVATANWNGYAGNSAYPNNGNNSYTGFPSQAVKEVWYSYNAGVANTDQYDIAKPKFHVTGLKTGHSYTITIGGSFTFVFTANTEYRINGSTLTGPSTLNCYNNASGVVTFTGIQPDGSGNLDIYVNAASGQEMGVLSAFTIVQTS